jgi:hypothetical protein
VNTDRMLCKNLLGMRAGDFLDGLELLVIEVV